MDGTSTCRLDLIAVKVAGTPQIIQLRQVAVEIAYK
jgi:hypothetical protein